MKTTPSGVACPPLDGEEFFRKLSSYRTAYSEAILRDTVSSFYRALYGKTTKLKF